MRPIGVQRSTLRYPLDTLFSSAAHVRLLRILAHEVRAPVGVADAARLAGLTPVGARTAFRRLEEAGFVERIGGGRTVKWALKGGGPMNDTLRQLFADEQGRYDRLVAALRGAVSLPEVLAAWIEPLPLSARAPVQIAVVAQADAIPWIQRELRARIIALEKELDVIVEVAAFTRADAPAPASDAVHLWGTLDESSSRRAPQTHAEADERALRMARAVADLIRSDPSLVQRAVQHVNRLLHEGHGTATDDVSEWRQLLETYSPERLRDLLVSGSSRAQRLRQSAPFFAVLTAAERDRVLAAMEKRP